jgi:hypothetical protein
MSYQKLNKSIQRIDRVSLPTIKGMPTSMLGLINTPGILRICGSKERIDEKAWVCCGRRRSGQGGDEDGPGGRVRLTSHS